MKKGEERVQNCMSCSQPPPQARCCYRSCSSQFSNQVISSPNPGSQHPLPFPLGSEAPPFPLLPYPLYLCFLAQERKTCSSLLLSQPLLSGSSWGCRKQLCRELGSARDSSGCRKQRCRELGSARDSSSGHGFPFLHLFLGWWEYSGIQSKKGKPTCCHCCP